MSIRIDGTNTTANPGITGGDADTGLQFGTDEVSIVTGGTEQAKVDSSGRLLVGTTTSQGINSGLQVVGDTGATIHRGNATAGNAPQLRLTRSRNTNYGSFTSVESGDELGKIAFAADDGTDYSTQAATIVAAVDEATGENDVPGRLMFATTIDGTNSPTERLRIDHRGQHLFQCSGVPSTDNLFTTVGGASSTTRLVSFRHSATLGSMGSGSESCTIRRNGNVGNTNNSYTGLSDVKLKENIVDATSQWDDVKNLQVRKYNFKAETGNETHTQIGLIAQEVELVCPGLVGESPDIDDEGNDLDTTTKIVNYSVLYMKAVKALQEAMERIETLEAKVAVLEANP